MVLIDNKSDIIVLYSLYQGCQTSGLGAGFRPPGGPNRPPGSLLLPAVQVQNI